MERRVVITGVGAMTAAGPGVGPLWRSIRAGESLVRAIERFDTSGCRSRVAAEIDWFVPSEWLDAKRLRRTDRFAQLAIGSAEQAIGASGIRLEAEDRERIGVSIGSALGGVAFAEAQHTAFLTGARSPDPNLALAIFGGAAACNVALEFGLFGPALSNANSCAAGAVAIGEAYRAIQLDEADLFLAGGAEAPLAPLTFRAFDTIRAMSQRNDAPATSCRPFDQERDGFVMGEGSAMLLLEERHRALARGAPILAEVIGYGATNDAFHMTQPRPDGSQAARAMTRALADSGLWPAEIDYINAHATGTPLGDAAEAIAIQQVFGRQSGAPFVSATKATYGHPLGASAAIEAVVCSLALTEGYLPATTNLCRPDTGDAIRHVPPGGMTRRFERALSTSFGFGGINAALVIAADRT